jgi:hypothetical protein
MVMGWWWWVGVVVVGMVAVRGGLEGAEEDGVHGG